ncbi:MAG TPA: hypothetical protein VFX95_10115 [Caulobacteraceae bacterium]|nr:hypothetical protein [Caulobacteraceae bacterium]
MRQAFVSLIAAAAVAAPAMAQEATPAVPPAPPAPTETPAMPAEPSLPQADPSTQTVPAVQTPPPAPVVEAPPPPPPPPAVPTEPTTIRTLSLIETLCKPLAQGGDPAAVTKSLGFRKKRSTYTLKVDRTTEFSVTPSASNPNVCTMQIDHPIGVDKDITVGLHDWAVARGYTLYRNDEFTTDMKRHTRSWEKTTDGKSEALVMITIRKPDGSPFSRRADRTTVMYSVQ